MVPPRRVAMHQFVQKKAAFPRFLQQSNHPLQTQPTQQLGRPRKSVLGMSFALSGSKSLSARVRSAAKAETGIPPEAPSLNRLKDFCKRIEPRARQVRHIRQMVNECKDRVQFEWLALRCQTGDPAAFADLIAVMERPLINYATSLTGNQDSALDVLQDSGSRWFVASES
jgi:hypothetical protein